MRIVILLLISIVLATYALHIQLQTPLCAHMYMFVNDDAYLFIFFNKRTRFLIFIQISNR